MEKIIRSPQPQITFFEQAIETVNKILFNISESTTSFNEIELHESYYFYDDFYNKIIADIWVTGKCPKCGATAAPSANCPNCLIYISPIHLIKPAHPLNGNAMTLKKLFRFRHNFKHPVSSKE